MNFQNEIEQFRQRFFENVIAEEKKKEQELKHKQATCFHLYNIKSHINQKGYQERSWSKCGLTAIKHIKIWEGTKGCFIS